MSSILIHCYEISLQGVTDDYRQAKTEVFPREDHPLSLQMALFLTSARASFTSSSYVSFLHRALIFLQLSPVLYGFLKCRHMAGGIDLPFPEVVLKEYYI